MLKEIIKNYEDLCRKFDIIETQVMQVDVDGYTEEVLFFGELQLVKK